MFEFEEDVDGLGDYPLGMVVIVFGFALVFFTEHILFDVHAPAEVMSPQAPVSLLPLQVKLCCRVIIL